MKKIIHSILKKYGFRIENTNTLFQKRRDYLTKYNVIINKDLVLESYSDIIKLEKYLSIESIEDYKEGVIISFNNLKLYVESREEFFIVSEVFVENDYNFLINEKTILVDIGCNIGMASLFFSTNSNVRKIIAFEPVKDTFENAKINFELNKSISSKIELYNFGLGSSNRKETFLFDKNIKGNTGIRGKKSVSYQISNSIEKREVDIKKTSEVFSNLLLTNENQNFVFKIDCEGAEYEILEDLAENNLLSKIKILMIEWHDEGAEILEKILLKNDFIIFSRNLEINSGMLYAYNKVL
ncbi:FkbM family methyltransferase [Flavobacterium sp. GB2R13]|uniref:FkbM family methyltransferase n=1 Tax=Flavobacterium algoris TaxID=3398733 RepID=UPI003A8B66E9